MLPALAVRQQGPSQTPVRLQAVETAASTRQGEGRRHDGQRPLSNTEWYGKSLKTRCIPWLPIIQLKYYNGAEKREAEVFNCSDASL